MARALIDDALAHHSWATLRLLDACTALTAAQLATPIAGIYGPVLPTMQHLIASDFVYQRILAGDESPFFDAGALGLGQLRVLTETTRQAWSELLTQGCEPDARFNEVDPSDGYTRLASAGVRVAQALHHAAEHRTQVCLALSTLGLEPPDLSAWQFGIQRGQMSEVIPRA